MGPPPAQSLVCGRTMESHADERLHDAIRHALNGDALLFLGAGASQSARGRKGAPLPTGQELANRLADECKLPPRYDLGSIAEFLVEQRSETTLINALRRHLKVENITADLETIASIPWSRIWTTNYDDAIERALDANHSTYNAITTAADVANARGNKLLVVHINGALANLKQSITPDFVLTSESYATNAFVDSIWSTVFRNDLQAARAVFFVGYSLYDLDVARILFNPAVISRKTHFIDRNDTDPVLETKLLKFGLVHGIGTEGFAKTITDEKSTWVRPHAIEQYESWKPVSAVLSHKESSDEDVYKLVLQGLLDQPLLLAQSDKPNEAAYTVVRQCEALAFKRMAQPNAVTLLIGSFSNGKSVTVQSLALQLAASGRDVFTLDRPTEAASNELRKLCRRGRDFVVVVENYSRNLALVETFCRYAPEGCPLLLSEKAEIHELRAPALLSKTSGRELVVYELDMLDETELQRMSDLLDLRGLWGERAGLSKLQRLAYLREDCGRQMHAVLIDVIKSPHIRARLANIIEHFESIDGGMRMLMALCLLQTIGEQPRTYVASDLLGLSYESFRKLMGDSVVRQILDVESGVALFRSPVIASAVLSGVENAKTVTDVVVDCVKRGHLSRHADGYLGRIATELTRFANLERLLPANGKRVALQNFYEELKSVPSIRNNPLFWLQYAMARLSLGELEMARRYFEQSYSIAAGSDFDTYQIDNHYCRLLLREAEETTDSDEAYQKVDKTIEILKRQVQREHRHYPYRSAWNLDGVARRHKLSWTDAQRNTVVAGARYLIEAATRLDDRAARSIAVVGGLERLGSVIQTLE